MTLRQLMEFKIYGVDGFHIENIFCNIKQLIKKKQSIGQTVTREDLKNIKSIDADKREGAIDTLIDDGFIKVAEDGTITIIKEINYSKNEQDCSV